MVKLNTPITNIHSVVIDGEDVGANMVSNDVLGGPLGAGESHAHGSQGDHSPVRAHTRDNN